jgi:hypothetical protein
MSHGRVALGAYLGAPPTGVEMKTPPLPNNVDRRCDWNTIRGRRKHFVIEGEIRRRQSTAPRKALYLQRIRCIADDTVDYRFGYYMIGVKPKMKGRWTWGQSAPLIPRADFRAIVKEAVRREWL